jgi:hypothetical protein
VSVVAIETSPGYSQWQRPIGGAALFVVNSIEGMGSFTITAYDENGDVIASKRFDPPVGAEAG